MFKILDCTLRDGGYYTNWDFDKNLVHTYIDSFNALPVDYLEVGYRSKPLSGYLGEFFYSPIYLLEKIRNQSNKKLVVILNEKDVNAADVESLLGPCIGLIDMIRLAIDPKNFKRALHLAEAVKKMGFEVGFNVMYMSSWSEQKDFLGEIKHVEGIAEYFYMVDSFGGVYPQDVKETYELVKTQTDVKVGFHGHNNLELGLINTITAIDCGVDMVDATVTGMGRGAGNLKTELLLTALNSKGVLEVDFDVLSQVVDPFLKLQESYQWGTNLPYMVSGANSLPQKEVMDWVGKRFYSFNSIIRALSNQSKGLKDNEDLENFESDKDCEKVLIVGGGLSVGYQAEALEEYLDQHPEVVIIHSSSRNIKVFENVKNRQIHCLSGNEGHRLEKIFPNVQNNNRIAILPPYPRLMGTYIPKFFAHKAYQLSAINFTTRKEAITAVAIETALVMGARDIAFVGYDGYHGVVSRNELELFNENENLFSILSDMDIAYYSFSPTKYAGLPLKSIYSVLS